MAVIGCSSSHAELVHQRVIQGNASLVRVLPGGHLFTHILLDPGTMTPELLIRYFKNAVSASRKHIKINQCDLAAQRVLDTADIWCDGRKCCRDICGSSSSASTTFIGKTSYYLHATIAFGSPFMRAF